LRAFLVVCGAISFFSLNCGPQHFFGMWPSDQFEFETPDVIQASKNHDHGRKNILLLALTSATTIAKAEKSVPTR
jgi:hypothetical protein